MKDLSSGDSALPQQQGSSSTDLMGLNAADAQDPISSTPVPTRPVPSAQVADLIAKLRETVDKLENGSTSRGDLKILSRTLQELRYAFKVFGPYRSRRKVTVFGSARTASGHPAYEQAVAFSRAMAARQWMVVTGAAGGIMEAGHLGAGREASMGLNILLPFEQSANPLIANDPKLVHLKYFFTRKLMFVKESHAMCCLPGGFGTLDEGLEVLTLLQTGKRDMVPVVFLDQPGGHYWRTFDQLIRQQLFNEGMICEEDLSLYKVTDQVEEATDEILTFYRIYHSMRYVQRRLVIRLQQPLSNETLDRLQAFFSDLLASGRFEISDSLEEEAEDRELAHLPRLVFHFTRHNFGRLRQLIDFLNRGTLPERTTSCTSSAAEF